MGNLIFSTKNKWCRSLVKTSEKPKAVKWDFDISDLRVYEVLFSQCGHPPRISMQLSGGDIRPTDLPMRHIAWYKSQLQSGPQWGSFIGDSFSNVTCFSRHWRNTIGETAQETVEHRGGNLWSRYWTCIPVLDLWFWYWTCDPGTGPVILVLDLWSWYWPCYPNTGLVNPTLTLWSWRCRGRDKTLGSQSSLFCKFLFV